MEAAVLIEVRLGIDRTEKLQATYKEKLDEAHRTGAEEPKPPQLAFFGFAYAVRVCTTIPGAAWLREEYNLDLTWEELCKKGWLNAENDLLNHYVRHIGKLEAFSPKFQRVKEVVAGLKIDVEGKPEGLVIISFSPLVCYILVKVCSVFILLRWIRFCTES